MSVYLRTIKPHNHQGDRCINRDISNNLECKNQQSRSYRFIETSFYKVIGNRIPSHHMTAGVGGYCRYATNHPAVKVPMYYRVRISNVVLLTILSGGYNNIINDIYEGLDNV